MIRTEYHYLTDCDAWMFCIVDDQDILAQGSEPELEIAIVRALEARKKLGK